MTIDICWKMELSDALDICIRIRKFTDMEEDQNRIHVKKFYHE